MDWKNAYISIFFVLSHEMPRYVHVFIDVILRFF